MLSVLILLRWHPDRMSLAPGCSVWVSGVGWVGALCVWGVGALCGGRDALGGGVLGGGYWELCVKAGRGCSRGSGCSVGGSECSVEGHWVLCMLGRLDAVCGGGGGRHKSIVLRYG